MPFTVLMIALNRNSISMTVERQRGHSRLLRYFTMHYGSPALACSATDMPGAGTGAHGALEAVSAAILRPFVERKTGEPANEENEITNSVHAMTILFMDSRAAALLLMILAPIR
jgi:hypothetical protein